MLEEKNNQILKEIALSLMLKSENKHNDNKGLMEGDFGYVLFLFYYSRYIREKKYKTTAENLLNNLLNKLENNQSGHCNGLSGILYLFEFLKKEEFVYIDLSEFRTTINEFLLNKSLDNINDGLNEFLHGSLGINYYFLKTNQQSIVNSYIDYLYDSAHKDNIQDTFCWIMGFEKLHSKTRSDISLSHGMSGLLIFLTRALEQGYTNHKIPKMIEKGINFILLQEIEYANYGSFYPNFALEENEIPQKSRLAWCYGDLGIALSLWYAGNVMKNKLWSNKAIEIFQYSIKRKLPNDTYITDSGICHGTAGVAMIFNRMYLNTGMQEFKDASEYWISETLRYLDETKELLSNVDFSLLTGLSGIGLVLLSYLTGDPQSWDELFLLSY